MASIKDKMSGYVAYSAVTSYPMVSIGNDAQKTKGANISKTLVDVGNRQKQDLDPKFFKSYELDADIPNENVFKCIIKNYTPKIIRKRTGESFTLYNDKTIG